MLQGDLLFHSPLWSGSHVVGSQHVGIICHRPQGLVQGQSAKAEGRKDGGVNIEASTVVLPPVCSEDGQSRGKTGPASQAGLMRLAKR